MFVSGQEQPLSLQHIRQQNASKIFHTLRQSPGISQSELVELTGIDQGTISVIINTLFDKGIVSRSKEASEGRVGRPRMALRLSKRAGIFLGASIDHRGIAIVATHIDGKIITRDHSRPGQSIEETLGQLNTLAKQVTTAAGYKTKDILGLGVAVPIIFAEGSQHILFSPNLNWPPGDLAPHLKQFEIPVFIDNDANAAALAEMRFGACQDIENYLYLGGLSGIGGGLIVGGQLYKGARGGAGEIGHIEVVFNGRRCGCGSRGCLEAYVSEKALLERMAERGTEVRQLSDLTLLAKNGHQFANYMLFEAAMFLGKALSTVNKLMNPERIVLGGVLEVLEPYIKDELEHSLKENSPKALPFIPQVVASSLGEDSVPMGGMVLALEGFLRQPEWFSN